MNNLHLNNRQKATIVQTLHAVEEYMDVTLEEIKGIKRYPRFVLARQVCMHILRETTTLSLQEIGDVFKRDHATVLWGISKIRNKLDKNEQFSNLYYKIKTNAQLKSVSRRYKYSVEGTIESINSTSTLFHQLSEEQVYECKDVTGNYIDMLEDAVKILKE